ncbi:MAG: hypothetical protein AAFN44_20805, partial [Pseudomonadota bacterium]
GLEAYTDLMKAGRVRAIAMSVYASGAIPPAEAIEWVSGLPGLQSIVFGASSKGNILGTRDLVAQYMPEAG